MDKNIIELLKKTNIIIEDEKIIAIEEINKLKEKRLMEEQKEKEE